MLSGPQVGSNLLSWEALSNCTDGRLTRFKYYQLSSWWATQDWTEIEEDKSDQIMRTDKWRKETSFWYWVYVETDGNIENEILKLWGEEFENWDLMQMCNNSYAILRKVVKSAPLKRNHLFATYRVYWSPVKLSKVTGNVYTCPRCMHVEADDTHMFMSC